MPYCARCGALLDGAPQDLTTPEESGGGGGGRAVAGLVLAGLGGAMLLVPLVSTSSGDISYWQANDLCASEIGELGSGLSGSFAASCSTINLIWGGSLLAVGIGLVLLLAGLVASGRSPSGPTLRRDWPDPIASVLPVADLIPPAKDRSATPSPSSTDTPPFDPVAALPRSAAGLALTLRAPRSQADMEDVVRGLPDASGPVAIARALGLTRSHITSTAEVGDFPAPNAPAPRSLEIVETTYRDAAPDELLAAYIADRTSPLACSGCHVARLTIAGKPVALITAAGGGTHGVFAYVHRDVVFEVVVDDLEGAITPLATAALQQLP